jgi:peptidoglycan biosynthesis protein MviN/MurJ (putative lipid II flippase)
VNKLRDVLRHLPATAVLAVTVLLVTAAPVLAHDNGEGWYGETNDRVVTNAGFVLIIFFPLFVFLVSLLQWQLEKRKDRRKAEAKRRAQAAGGW